MAKYLKKEKQKNENNRVTVLNNQLTTDTLTSPSLLSLLQWNVLKTNKICTKISIKVAILKLLLPYGNKNFSKKTQRLE